MISRYGRMILAMTDWQELCAFADKHRECDFDNGGYKDCLDKQCGAYR